MGLGCVCVTVPVGIRAVFFGNVRLGVLGVGEHDNVYLVAFLSGFYFLFSYHSSTLLFCSALQ
jgi:hypothetical protein